MATPPDTYMGLTGIEAPPTDYMGLTSLGLPEERLAIDPLKAGRADLLRHHHGLGRRQLRLRPEQQLRIIICWHYCDRFVRLHRDR